MERGISYLNRTFKDYKEALIDYSKKYFPDFNTTYDDASVASWLIDLNAAVSDDLSYHIDRVYQETNIDSAQEKGSLYNLARNKGVKIPGPKGAMAEVIFSFVIDASNDGPDERFAPVIKRGTKVSSANHIFEVMEDIDFAEQFNSHGISDRTIRPMVNTNNIITGYTVSKRSVVVAGETKIYRQIIRHEDVKPFMEVVLPFENVMNIESIITVDGDNAKNVPSYGTFYTENETCGGVTRFFEVDYLAETERWGDKLENGLPKKYVYGYRSNGEMIPTCEVTRGEWKPVEHKFMTEYTDNGYLKAIFGANTGVSNAEIGNDMSDFSKYQISRMLNNKTLGVLPTGNSTMFILYRVGGGSISNVAAGAINRVASLNAEFRGNDITKVNKIKSSLIVTNTAPSVSGKDMPTAAEMRYLIKYHNAAQERCVTLKDYIDRILNLPPKYGTPFRVGVSEENNKIVIYLLGLNDKGQLDTLLPYALVKNIEDYLKAYRMINDFVEIKAGHIINLAFDVDVMVDKNYNKSDVVMSVIETVRNYMDINRHNMGEEIFVGDLEKEISKVDGVLNLIDLRVYNKKSIGYSTSTIPQPTSYGDEADGYGDADMPLIDIKRTDGVLYNDGDSMMEIKVPSVDIKVRVKER